jgi:hypothetical protein
MLATLTFSTIGEGSSPIAFIFDTFNTVVGQNSEGLSLTAGTGSVQVAPNPVPEPGTWLLMSTGLVSLLGYGWRKRQQAA